MCPTRLGEQELDHMVTHQRAQLTGQRRDSRPHPVRSGRYTAGRFARVTRTVGDIYSGTNGSTTVSPAKQPNSRAGWCHDLGFRWHIPDSHCRQLTYRDCPPTKSAVSEKARNESRNSVVSRGLNPVVLVNLDVWVTDYYLVSILHVTILKRGQYCH